MSHDKQITYRKEKLWHTSYIASTNTFSKIDRNPRAPVFLDIAFLAIELRELSVKCSFT